MTLDQYHFEPHRWVHHRSVGRDVCAHCGLVLLLNEATTRAVRWGCNWRDHPVYLRELERKRRS